MESIFDAPMNDGCPTKECPVHYRNDHHGQDEGGSDYWISYIGEYAVYTGIGVRHDMAAQDVINVTKESMIALLSGGEQEAEKIAMKAMEGFSILYKVGDGAIGDVNVNPNGDDQWYGEIKDNEARHEMVKTLAAVMGI